MGSMNMDSTTCMKIHQFSRDLMSWDQLNTLAPKLSDTSTLTTFDLKTFIRHGTGRAVTTVASTTNSDSSPRPKPQVETHPGGTRWNPTQEQIELLEAVYQGGMRTPNAQQIEHITERLSKHGKIEGKNVFYWFQNHKARERQRHKRNTTTTLALSGPPRTSPISSLTTVTTETKSDHGQQEESVYKRKSRSWASEEESRRLWSCSCKDEDGDRTLELFPLHPEGRF